MPGRPPDNRRHMTESAKLSDQLGITFREIQSRKRLFGVGEADAERLMRCIPLIRERSDAILEAFFKDQIDHPGVQPLIEHTSDFSRIHKGLQQLLEEGAAGSLNPAFVEKRLRLGQTLQEAGVSLQYPYAAVRLLLSILSRELAERFPEDAAAMIDSWSKVLHFDLHLMAEGALLFATQSAARLAAADSGAPALTEAPGQAAAPEGKTPLLGRRDALTYLYNQKALEDHLKLEAARAERRNEAFCLVSLNINGFEDWIRQNGEKAGRDLQIKIAKVALETFRETDIPSRYGDGTFLIIMPKATAAQAADVCRRLIKTYKKSPVGDGNFSLGIAQNGPDNFKTPDALLSAAAELAGEAQSHAADQSGFYIRRSVESVESSLPSLL